MRVLVVALVVITCVVIACVGLARPALGGPAPPVTAASVDQIVAVPHEPPVDAPVIDPFRPPAGPYAPGNRGLEYDTSPGQAVRASSGGTVTFAGQVGGYLFVTVQHSAELRTTVGFVDEVLVSAGDRVQHGQVIATAGHTMHFTARRNGSYIDPELLFQRFRVAIRLVAESATT